MASACVCNGWNCGAGSGREVEVASLAAREAEVTSTWRLPVGQL